MSAILQFQKPHQLDPEKLAGYKPPNRVWIPFSTCACLGLDCRWHKKRKCPAITQYEKALLDKHHTPKPIKIITLWASRERK